MQHTAGQEEEGGEDYSGRREPVLPHSAPPPGLPATVLDHDDTVVETQRMPSLGLAGAGCDGATPISGVQSVCTGAAAEPAVEGGGAPI